jgi:hypothetical protein
VALQTNCCDPLREVQMVLQRILLLVLWLLAWPALRHVLWMV